MEQLNGEDAAPSVIPRTDRRRSQWVVEGDHTGRQLAAISFCISLQAPRGGPGSTLWCPKSVERSGTVLGDELHKLDPAIPPKQHWPK